MMIAQERSSEFSEVIKNSLEELVSFIVSHGKPEDYARRILYIYVMKESNVPVTTIAKDVGVGNHRLFNLYRKACFYLDKFVGQET